MWITIAMMVGVCVGYVLRSYTARIEAKARDEAVNLAKRI